MKRILRALTLFTCFIRAVSTDGAELKELYLPEKKPLIAVVLMVKDEEHVMASTLHSYVKGGIKDYLIYDTGSKDNTIEVTKNYFDDHGINNYFIEQEPFVDFSTSRNRALDLADQKFPNAAFFLMPDAEWHLQGVKDLLEFCKNKVKEASYYAIPCYQIKVRAGTEFVHTRLMKAGLLSPRFKGVVHEVLMPTSYEKVPETVYFELHTTERGAQKSYARFKRDKELLLKDHEREPDNTRTLTYLALTCEWLDDEENVKDAYSYFRQRCAMKGWPEEDFICQYHLGIITERIAERYNQLSWAEALEHYLKAHAMRPNRAEPLVRIANHYWKMGDQVNCFLFGFRAAMIPFPKDDFLFIEKYIYDFERYHILSKSAWYVQEFEIGEFATRKAIECCPEAAQFYRNLALYLEHKGSARNSSHDLFAMLNDSLKKEHPAQA